MSKKQPAKGTPAAAKQTAPVDLTRSDLPGGNHAYWYKPDELSVRRSREIDVYDIHLIPRLRELALAQGLIDEEGNNLVDPDNALPMLPSGFTKEESRSFLEMQDVNAWAYLKGWTLRSEGGAPKPLPVDADALLELPRDVYQALIDHSAKIIAGRVDFASGDQFSPDAVEDEESPSGA